MAKQLIDLTGKTFNRLTVLSFERRKGRIIWKCRCVCGNETFVYSFNLKDGNIQSCGCLNKEIVSKVHTKHGQASNYKPTAEYRTFCGAKSRCQNPNDKAYENYGGRGISFCFNSFQEFFAEVGKRPTIRHTIERINNEGNYEKGNIRWATRKEQSNNTRRSRLITYQGVIKTATQWSEDFNVSLQTITTRIDRSKWCIECALTRPISKGKGNICPH